VEKIVAAESQPKAPEEKPAGGKKEEKEVNVIDISEFGRIEIKVGRILSAGAVEKSDKLVILSVDVGRTIQIVAGIGKAYAPEELAGKHIAVVTNLKPATLMGLPSEGMLLATDTSDGRLTLVGFDRPPRVGARIR
jgi:methionyl-tRNA synthetase